VAHLLKYSGPTMDELLEAAAYNLFPEWQAFDWQVGEKWWYSARLIGIPSLMKGGAGVTTELAIHNVNPNPGWTDFAIYIYDQNGLLGFDCEKLNEKQSEYINLDSWGYINPGFKGSAVIWGTETTQWYNNPYGWSAFGLTAVKVERLSTVLGTDVPGDESTVSEGFPVYPWWTFDFQGPQLPTCPGQPTGCNIGVVGTVYEHGWWPPVPSDLLIQIWQKDGVAPVWTGQTDAAGHFLANLPDEGTYKVRAYLDGEWVWLIFRIDDKESYYFDASCDPGQYVWELRLPGFHTIYGYAVETCGTIATDTAKLAGATVELWWDNVKVGSTTTNSEGYFQFRNVMEHLYVPYHVKICFKDFAGNTVCFETNPFILDSKNVEARFYYDSTEPNDSYWCWVRDAD